MDITIRKNIKIGMLVEIAPETKDNKNGDQLIRGYVVKILSQANHRKGIKVQLYSGEIGRVKHIVTKDQLRFENFKFYNEFFFKKVLYVIWNKETRTFLIFDHYNKMKNRIEKTTLLFDDRRDAESFIHGTTYDDGNHIVRELHRKKPIVELFSNTDVEYFRINGTRKLSKERLEEWEYYFKNMR